MQTTENLRQALYDKALKEQSEFVKKLMSSPPKAIIDAAYEKVMRDDILMIFEEDSLSEKQVRALLRLDYPLAACYNDWLKNDCSHMEALRDTVGRLAEGMARSHINKSEPER